MIWSNTYNTSLISLLGFSNVFIYCKYTGNFSQSSSHFFVLYPFKDIYLIFLDLVLISCSAVSEVWKQLGKRFWYRYQISSRPCFCPSVFQPQKPQARTAVKSAQLTSRFSYLFQGCQINESFFLVRFINFLLPYPLSCACLFFCGATFKASLEWLIT